MSPRSTWSKYAWIDWAVAIPVAVVYLIARSAGMTALVSLDPTGRSDLYGSLVQAAGGYLAFAVVPAAIIVALTPGPRLRQILGKHSGDLRGATVGAAFAGIGLTLSCVAGLALDTGANSNTPARYLILVTTITSALGVLRLLEQFSILLGVIGVDAATAGRAAKLPRRLSRPGGGSGSARVVDPMPEEDPRRRPAKRSVTPDS